MISTLLNSSNAHHSISFNLTKHAHVLIPIAKLTARDLALRESWVNAMEARLVREELAKCRRGEGVNAYANCKHLADLYLDLLKDAQVSPHYFLVAFC